MQILIISGSAQLANKCMHTEQRFTLSAMMQSVVLSGDAPAVRRQKFGWKNQGYIDVRTY